MDFVSRQGRPAHGVTVAGRVPAVRCGSKRYHRRSEPGVLPRPIGGLGCGGVSLWRFGFGFDRRLENLQQDARDVPGGVRIRRCLVGSD